MHFPLRTPLPFGGCHAGGPSFNSQWIVRRIPPLTGIVFHSHSGRPFPPLKRLKPFFFDQNSLLFLFLPVSRSRLWPDLDDFPSLDEIDLVIFLSWAETIVRRDVSFFFSRRLFPHRRGRLEK